MSEPLNFERMDRRITSLTTFTQAEQATRAFWHSHTPLERLAVLALLRQELFGDDGTQPRLQRVFDRTQRSRR
jgi:hypothetical protein